MNQIRAANFFILEFWFVLLTDSFLGLQCNDVFTKL
jgi:hypothetical protein